MPSTLDEALLQALPLIRSVLYGPGAGAEYPVPDAGQAAAWA